MQKKIDLRDLGSERSLLATVIQGGKDAYIDASSIVSAKDLALPINKSIFNSVQSLVDDPNCVSIDPETIKTKMGILGYGEMLKDSKNLEYLETICRYGSNPKNLNLFALQVRKFSVARELLSKHEDSIKFLSELKGTEKISDIIKNSEEMINDYLVGANDLSSSQYMAEGIDQYIANLIENDPVDQIGIPTGFPLWDNAVGGHRKAAISIVVSRSKVGKSWSALNIARNVGKKKIPVLYLDTEMTKTVQQARLLSMDSGCPMKLLETSQFKHSDEYRNSVIESGKNIQDYSITYQNVSGVTHTEAMTMIKRWLTKVVGFDGRGKANECLIIYDYIKLVSGENIASNMPEYMLLFLVMTDLHNFAVKYEIPIIGFVQANREGIDIEDSRIIAGSDRILWLCSSMSLLKNKTQQDIEEGGSNWQAGNKKLMVIDTRYGPGIEEFDYINLKASIRPNVNEREATGLFVEGEKHSTVVYDTRRDNKDSEPKDRVSIVGTGG